MDIEGSLKIELVQQADYRFTVHFPDPVVSTIVTDEGAPIGSNAGPSPTMLLGTSVANCLAASLLFAMRKHKNEPGPLRVVSTVNLTRNPQRRLRIGGIGVDLHLGVAAARLQMLDRVLAQFEDFCVVTQSVRAAIPVTVRVIDRDEAVLWAPLSA